MSLSKCVQGRKWEKGIVNLAQKDQGRRNVWDEFSRPRKRYSPGEKSSWGRWVSPEWLLKLPNIWALFHQESSGGKSSNIFSSHDTCKGGIVSLKTVSLRIDVVEGYDSSTESSRPMCSFHRWKIGETRGKQTWQNVFNIHRDRARTEELNQDSLKSWG